MSRKAKHGGKVRKTRYTDYERWVGLPHFMLKSMAWAGRPADPAAGIAAVGPLLPNAKAIFIAVWQRFNGINNGEISYAVREAKGLGINKNQAGEAFDQLTERGFLRVGTNSSFDQKRLSREWIVTALPMPDGTKGSNDFMSWRPDPLQSRQRDYEGRPKNKTQSRQRDAQSRPRDYDPKSAANSPPTVPPTGLLATDSESLQSRPRDTSILPCGVRGGDTNSIAVDRSGAPSSSSATNGKRPWSAPTYAEHRVERVSLRSIAPAGNVTQSDLNRCIDWMTETAARPVIAVRRSTDSEQPYVVADAIAAAQVHACRHLKHRKVDVTVVDVPSESAGIPAERTSVSSGTNSRGVEA